MYGHYHMLILNSRIMLTLALLLSNTAFRVVLSRNDFPAKANPPPSWQEGHSRSDPVSCVIHAQQSADFVLYTADEYR